MKKFYFLFSFIIVCISCSSDSSSVAVNPNLLQRVDFFPTIDGIRWHFNAVGLLTEITKADGTLKEKFIYDADNNVIQDIKYVNGSASENYLITYDSNNKITAINGKHYNYSASENRYYYTDGFDTYSCLLNSDFLVIESLFAFDDGVDFYNNDYSCTYNLGNMGGYFNDGWGTDILTHFEFDNKTNPLKNALLPILRFKSLNEVEFFFDSFSSANNITSQGFFSDDPESYTYDYSYNANNLPQIQTRNDYNFGVYENSLISAKYYYQGDVLP